MAVRFSITVFLAAIILFASVIVLVNVAIIIWGLAASSFSSLSSRVKAWWHSRPVLLFRLGGITILRQKLNYNFTMCQDSMEAGEKVRTLSCCKNMRIDQRVLSATRLLLTRPILMITRILKNVKAPRSAQGPGAWPSQIGGSLAPSGMCNISWRCAWVPYERRKTPTKF